MPAQSASVPSENASEFQDFKMLLLPARPAPLVAPGVEATGPLDQGWRSASFAGMSVEPGEKSGGSGDRRRDGGTRLQDNGSRPRQREAAVGEASQALVRGISDSAGRRRDGGGRVERSRETRFGLRVQAEGPRDREESREYQRALPETGPSH